jgi:hypothetical protein
LSALFETWIDWDCRFLNLTRRDFADHDGGADHVGGAALAFRSKAAVTQGLLCARSGLRSAHEIKIHVRFGDRFVSGASGSWCGAGTRSPKVGDCGPQAAEAGTNAVRPHSGPFTFAALASRMKSGSPSIARRRRFACTRSAQEP